MNCTEPSPGDSTIECGRSLVHDEGLWHSYLAVLESASGLPDRLALETLEAHGLASREESDLVPLNAAPHLAREASRLDEEAAELRRAARQVEAAIDRGSGGHWCTELRTTKELLHHYSALQLTARFSVDAWDRMPHLVPTDRQQQSTAQPAAMAQGVQYRAIYDEEVLRDPNLFRIMEKSVRDGEDARVSRRLPCRLLLRDNEEALIILCAHEGPLAGLLTHDSRIVEVISGLFDVFWSLSTPIRLTRAGRDEEAPAGPTDDSLRLLAHLSTGLTDQAIARELGVSERTVARRISQLCESLGASSRFQLGARAVLQGWIS